jgi:hypothetical protein
MARRRLDNHERRLTAAGMRPSTVDVSAGPFLRPPSLSSGDALLYPPAMPRRFDGPAMDLANMRSLGVRSIFAMCECGRRADVDVSALPDALEVPALARRLRCSACGARPIDVRPDWREHRAQGTGC